MTGIWRPTTHQEINGDPKGEFGCPFCQPLLLFLLLKYFPNFVYTCTVSSQYVYNICENGWQLVKSLQNIEIYKLYPSTLFTSVCQIVFSTCVQQQKKIDKIKGWLPWPAKFSFESPFLDWRYESFLVWFSSTNRCLTFLCTRLEFFTCQAPIRNKTYCLKVLN